MNIILALILGMVAYSSLNIGMVLEKKGASMLPEIEHTSVFNNIKNFLSCRIWVYGIILTSAQVILLMIVLTMAPLSLITPLFGFGIIVLVIFSRLYLKESMSKVEYFGIGITILGIILLGLFSSPEEKIYTIYEILKFFSTPFSLIYFIGFTIITTICCLYSALNGYKSAAIIFGFASGMAAAYGSIFMKGVSSGFNQFSIQSTLINIYWIIMLLISFGGNGISMVFLQIGFQKGKAVIVAPIYSVIAMIFPTISGILILNEWAGQLFTNILIQTIGFIIIIIGIIILSFYNELKKSKEPIE